MKLFDMWVDFVNLRSEEYCETSRIPTMKFGTVEEDAYRRDLTINSIIDLKCGKIVTLPPKETFLDDPLHVFCAIRFGARFNFELDEALKEAVASSEVKTSMADKISRERIGHEGVMWPFIHGLKGKWYPATIPESSMKSLNGYKVFISIDLILGDGLYNFLKVLFFTMRGIHAGFKEKNTRTCN